MSYLRDQDDLRDHHHDDVLANKEHELTLSTAAIFGIFFGQVVLCGIFFGFGYSLGGHRSSGLLPSESSSSSNPNFGSFKPAAGSPAGDHAATASAPSTTRASATPTAPAETPVSMGPEASESAPVAETTARPSPAPIVRLAQPPAESPKPVATPAPVATGGFMVQVAAISVTHPDDATMLQNALRAKGYSVAQHSGPDQFIHLLLGPFHDRATAESMRERLRTDGYIAYIK